MTQSMELIERIEQIRKLTPLDAAEELARLPAGDIQFILSRLPVEQALSDIMVREPFAFQQATQVKDAVSEVRGWKLYERIATERSAQAGSQYGVAKEEQINDYPTKQLLRKQILLGALNGAVVGVIAGIAMFAYALATDSANLATLGLLIFIAMIGACIGSGIFLTTFTDIIGMGLMLFLATTLVL